MASDIPLNFNSFFEVRAWIEQQRPVKPLITDPSYPKSVEQQKLWVQAIVPVLHNMQNVVDGEKLLKQWGAMIRDEPINIEVVAWKLLVRAIFTNL